MQVQAEAALAKHQQSWLVVITVTVLRRMYPMLGWAMKSASLMELPEFVVLFVLLDHVVKT
jgi:hypothetical protein